ncbi:MAG TPA: ABC transporter substrate-binding protein [Thermosynechococcaceae cyanobacterium]
MKLIGVLQQWLAKRWRRSQTLQQLGWGAIGLLAAVLVALPSFSQQPVVLKLLMTAPDAPSWSKIIAKAFEAQNPGIKLQIVEGPNATNLVENLYTTSFLLGESPYDLVMMDVIWTPKFAAAGWLKDLTNEFSPQELAAFSSADVNGGKFQNKLYRIPTRSDAGVLYYRKDLLEKNGFGTPQNLEEMTRVAKTLQDKKQVRWGYLWQGQQYEGAAAMFVEILQGFGGFWVNPDNLEVGLDRPEAIQAVDFLKGTIAQGISPPGVTTYMEEDTRRIFQAGDAAFLRSWPYVWPLANADNSPVKGKVGIMPLMGSAGQAGGSCLGGWGLGIAKSTRHEKEALRVLRFLSNLEAQKQFILEGGYVPSVRRLFSDRAVLAKYPHYPQILKVVDKAVLRPPIAQYAQVSDILQRYLSAALTSQRSTEDAMKQAAAETRRVVEAGRKKQAGEMQS